jgi:hypothetical protein
MREESGLPISDVSHIIKTFGPDAFYTQMYNFKEDSNGCWIYQGRLDHGYARLSFGKYNKYKGHRLWYELYTGISLPRDRMPDHLCRNKACINPKHLESVSNTINVQRGKSAKITMEIARQIRNDELKDQFWLSKKYNLDQSCISRIINNKSWVE